MHRQHADQGEGPGRIDAVHAPGAADDCGLLGDGLLVRHGGSVRKIVRRFVGKIVRTIADMDLVESTPEPG
ncbi:hypothetical protein GCM10010862_10490 [Devosia nitrariae]|uniref:Uncharacterized protein n=1 Tax=Devosia nitrariae TaxID=2071872 RepID=A0ABQ5W1J5_9HYPH|nr:hypothetical protein GCM10010862_10490 [Devosia nitrariae]